MHGLQLSRHPEPRAAAPASTTDSALGSPRGPPALACTPGHHGRWVPAVAVVSHDGLGHGAPHGRPGLGHHVAAQVHHVRRNLRQAPRPPRPEDPLLRSRGSGQPAEHGGVGSSSLGSSSAGSWSGRAFQTSVMIDPGWPEALAACWEL